MLQPTTQIRNAHLLSAQAARLEKQEGLASQQVPLASPAKLWSNQGLIISRS